jgi:(p)ppGpp synthase/HD superfamily hydrolase
VADMVADLSDNKALPEPKRKQEYFARLAASDWRVLLIKLADAWDNVQDARSPLLPGHFRAKRLQRSLDVVQLARRRPTRTDVLDRACGIVEGLCGIAAAERRSDGTGV